MNVLRVGSDANVMSRTISRQSARSISASMASATCVGRARNECARTHHTHASQARADRIGAAGGLVPARTFIGVLCGGRQSVRFIDGAELASSLVLPVEPAAAAAAGPEATGANSHVFARARRLALRARVSLEAYRSVGAPAAVGGTGAGGGIGTRPLDLSGSGGGTAVSPAVALTLNWRPRKPGPVEACADGAS